MRPSKATPEIPTPPIPPDPIAVLHQAIRDQIGNNPALTADTAFDEDLGFDSLDYLELVLDLEGTLGLEIDETALDHIQTVGQAEAALMALYKAQYQS